MPPAVLPPTHLWRDGKRKYSLHSYGEGQGGGCKGVVCGNSGGAVFRLAIIIVGSGCW